MHLPTTFKRLGAGRPSAWLARATGWSALPARVRQGVLWVVLVVALAAYPMLDAYFDWQTLNTMTDAAIYVVLALGLNIVVGYAGLLDLGYAAFFAIGAYTTGILTWPPHGIQLNFWLAMLAGVPIAALFGILIGAPTLRVRGDYLAIITLAFGEIIPLAVRNLFNVTIKIGPFVLVDSFNLTNGIQGLNPVGRPSLFGYEFGFTPLPWYCLILFVGALVVLGSRRLEHSRIGRAWMAVREDEAAAACMGVDPVRTKLLAFALGASFSSFAGAIYAAKLQAIFPELFRFQVSIMLLCMVILGGMGNVKGVIVGGLFIIFFDRVVLAQSTQLVRGLGELLGIAALQRVDLGLWRWLFFGATLIVVMVFRPEGLFPSAGRAAELRAGKVQDAEGGAP
jgi:branched-chain amino acid transport system permease protein